MPDEPSLAQLLPPRFLLLIRDRIKAGVTDAVAKFQLNAADEDSVTGALAQAISTATPLVYRGPEGNFQFEIRSLKIRGRGKGAPEKRLGADGILQIVVSKNGKRVFTKGLPFQAKIEGGFENQAVRQQAASLYRTSETGLIVRYAADRYTGVDVRDLFRPVADGQPDRVVRQENLGTVFGDRFLDCEIGRMGLTYNDMVTTLNGRGTWVIDTDVKILDRE